MLQRMLTSALIAGAVAGLIAALLQVSFVQPLLLQAELYEQGVLTHVPGEGGHDHSHDPGDQPPESVTPEHGHAVATDVPRPVTGWALDPARDGLSLLFSILVYCGWGLLLIAVFASAERSGRQVTAQSGLVWGIGGFVAVQLAPAFGLPPELPGMAAAEIGARVSWWLATVALSAVGLLLLAYGKRLLPVALGVVVIALPHLFGAPHPDVLSGPTPPELAAQFAGRALGVGLVAWAVLGVVAAKIWNRPAIG